MNYKRLFIQNCVVFLTIVTNNRLPILIENIDLLKISLQNVIQFYKFDLIAYSVLPDHIHCIIKPLNANEYPKIVKSFKYSFSKNFNVGLVNPTYKKLWQNRFWEHTIRDEQDLNRHIDYIHYNPIKHYQISPKDWVYSSFKKYVKQGLYDINWCNYEDKNKINDINIE